MNERETNGKLGEFVYESGRCMDFVISGYLSVRLCICASNHRRESADCVCVCV